MLTDTCLFVRRKSDGKIILLCLYVDDIYCATSTVEMQQELIDALKAFVEIKVLGVPDQLLGITLSWGGELLLGASICGQIDTKTDEFV